MTSEKFEGHFLGRGATLRPVFALGRRASSSDGSITKFEFNFNFNYFSVSVYFFVVIVNIVVQSLRLGFRLGLGLRTIEAIGIKI